MTSWFKQVHAVLSGLVLLTLFWPSVPAQSSPGSATDRSLLQSSFSKLPVYFVENQAVYPEEVAYYIRGANKTLFFGSTGITIRLHGKSRAWVVKLEFVDANPHVQPRGKDRQQAVFSHFSGPEKDWKAGLPTFSKVVYRDLWPGIDLVYRGTSHELKYDFVVAPGADPSRIRLRYQGAPTVSLNRNGSLQVATPEGSFEDAAPVAWQETRKGERVPVEVAFRLNPDVGRDVAEFGFRIGDYDDTKTLVLDPAMLLYCGYLGGSSTGVYGESGNAIAVDAGGNTYVTGQTHSDQQTFPVSLGPSAIHNGYVDVFVAKVNPSGTGLVYCGYIGGTSGEWGEGIAVDAAGNAYVTGFTVSDERTFPVINGPDLTYNGSGNDFDCFVAKVNPLGTALVYCGYIGGNSSEKGNGIAVDAAGNAYVTGETTSNEQTFPVQIGPDLTFNGALTDTFVAKVNPLGTGLVYCGYIGGNGTDSGKGIAVDTAGSAYVTGTTWSSQNSFPVVGGPDVTFNGGLTDSFVAKVNPLGTALVYCGYIGGSGEDAGNGIAVDANSNAYVAGTTASTETTFPVTVGPDLTHNGAKNDAFVAKVNAAGTALVYCGYIGGAGNESSGGIALDVAGNAYVTGNTGSGERTFPVKSGPDVTANGSFDAFVTKVDVQGTRLVYCGYIGGNDNETATGIAVDASGNAYVTGSTYSTQQTFPVKIGPDLTFNGGANDAFVAKVTIAYINGTGTPRPGGTINLFLSAGGDAGLVYQIGSSLGAGPTPIDTRQIALSPDGLLEVTAHNLWPSIFSGYRGVMDSNSQAQAAIRIPNLPALIGNRLHTAFVTLDPQAPSFIRSISDPFSFSITK